LLVGLKPIFRRGGSGRNVKGFAHVSRRTEDRKQKAKDRSLTALGKGGILAG